MRSSNTKILKFLFIQIFEHLNFSFNIVNSTMYHSISLFNYLRKFKFVTTMTNHVFPIFKHTAEREISQCHVIYVTLSASHYVICYLKASFPKRFIYVAYASLRFMSLYSKYVCLLHTDKCVKSTCSFRPNFIIYDIYLFTICVIKA